MVLHKFLHRATKRARLLFLLVVKKNSQGGHEFYEFLNWWEAEKASLEPYLTKKGMSSMSSCISRKSKGPR